jgi:hypothetical protein
LLSLHADADADMGAVKAIVQRRVAQLMPGSTTCASSRTGLMALAEACPGHGATAECPILAALTREPQA